MTVAPRPASAAARTASLEGSSNDTRSACGSRPSLASASSKTDLVPDPRSRSTQSTCARSATVSRFRPTSSWSGSGNNQNLIACDDSLHELLAMYGSFDKAQFRAASLDFRDHLRGIRHVEAYLDLRIGPSECDQTRGQPITGNRLAGVNRKQPRFSSPNSTSANSAAWADASTARASFRKTRPASVSSMWRPTLLNSFVPCCASRLAMAWLAADCARFKANAASVTCCRSATATKTRS